LAGIAVVVDRDAEHPLEMASLTIRPLVEPFDWGCAGGTFGDRVCLRSPDRRADDLDPLDSERGVDAAREFAVAILDEEVRA
jgi:hypothetical protein